MANVASMTSRGLRGLELGSGSFLLFRSLLLQLIHFLLLLGKLLFSPAALPAVLPVADKELETEGIDSHTRLEADAQIAIVHLVLVHIGMEEIEMAGDGEQKVVVVGRELGEFILQHLWGCRGASTLLSN